MSDRPTYASVVANAGFRSLWINQILVQIAYNTLNFALIIWVYKLIGNNTSISILMLAIYSPGIIFGLFSGIFADFVDKKKIVLGIDLLLAVSFLAMLFTKSIYPLLLLNAFIINSLSTFFMPSESSSIPLLVDKKHLFLANSLFSLTLYASIMIGFSIGGPVLNHFGMDSILMLGAGMFLVALFFVRNLPSLKTYQASQKMVLDKDSVVQLVSLTMKESLQTARFIRSQLAIAAAMFLLAVVQGFVGVLAVLMPSYMEEVLKIHATDASYIMMVPLGLGMVTGAYIVGKYFHNRPRRSLVLPAVLLAGIIFILVGVAPSLGEMFQSSELPSHVSRLRYFMRVPSLSVLFAVGAYVLGFCAVSMIIPCQTVLQENTPAKNRGKIFAVLSVLMTTFSAIPIGIAGVLADSFGVTPIFLGLGIITLMIGLLASRPQLFFEREHLPFKVRDFLGEGHWEESLDR